MRWLDGFPRTTGSGRDARVWSCRRPSPSDWARRREVQASPALQSAGDSDGITRRRHHRVHRSFVEEKGLRFLTAALDPVSTPWRAIFVGGGPLEKRTTLVVITHRGRVRIVPALVHDRVPDYLKRFELLCARATRHRPSGDFRPHDRRGLCVSMCPCSADKRWSRTRAWSLRRTMSLGKDARSIHY